MTLPPWTSAKIAVKGIWAAVVALILFASVAVAVVRTVQLDGMRFLFVNIEGERQKTARLEKQIAAMKEAAAEATRLQKERFEKAERDYQELAKEIDEDAEQEVAAIRDSTERFIADNRVRCKVPARRTAAPAEDNRTRGREEVRSTPVLDAGEAMQEDRVAVTADDVRLCTANTLQAEQAREWGLKLEEMNNVDNP